jgi:hypothetical protein
MEVGPSRAADVRGRPSVGVSGSGARTVRTRAPVIGKWRSRDNRSMRRGQSSRALRLARTTAFLSALARVCIYVLEPDELRPAPRPSNRCQNRIWCTQDRRIPRLHMSKTALYKPCQVAAGG